MVHSLSVLVAALVPLAPAADSAEWRVVVQEGAVSDPVCVSNDGTLLAVVAGQHRNVLQVVDTRAPRVSLAVRLPVPVRAAAIRPDNRCVAVSTEEAVALVELADGRVETLIPGASGVLAWSGNGAWLGVLGQLAPAAPGAGRPGENAELGVWDLKAQRWRARAETPIAIDHEVVFDGDTLVGYGRGGRVFARAASSFPCDVRLDGKTGKAVQTVGPVSPDRGVKPKDEAKARYEIPAVVLAARKQRAGAVERAKERVGMRLGAPEGRPVPHGFAAVSLSDRVRFAVQRAGAESWPSTAVFTLHADGRIGVEPPVERARDLWPLGIALVGRGEFLHHPSFVDLVTGKPFVSLPIAKEGGDRFLVFEKGVLMNQDRRLGYYPPGSTEAAWSVALARPSEVRLAASADGRTVAIAHADERALVTLVNTADGKVRATVPRPEKGEQMLRSLSLDRRGERLAVVIGESLRLYDGGSGKLVAEQELTPRSFAYYAHPILSGWLLSGAAGSVLHDEKTGRGQTFAVEDVTWAEEIDTPWGRRLLMETRPGRALVADFAGKVLGWRPAAPYQSWVGGPREFAPTAVPLGGKVLVRSVGWNGVVEVVSLRDLATLATIHPVRVGNAIGWVAHTPDGIWDASPGAERYVAVFRKGEAVKAEDRDARRQPKTIQARLKGPER